MATQIQIKRGTTPASGLTVGELALYTSTNQIYIGGTGGTVWVGGVVTGGVDMGAGSAVSANQIPTQSGVYNYVRNNFVSSFNGATGAVGGVTTSVANTFTALNTFSAGISAAGATFGSDLKIQVPSAVTEASYSTIGHGSGGNGVSDFSNTVFGVSAGWNIVADAEFLGGLYNTLIGWGSGRIISSGTSNTAVGWRSLSSADSNSNTAIGYSSLVATTTGYSNTAIGTNIMTANTTGSENTAVGVLALSGNTSGSNNVAVGKDALLNNKTGAIVAVGHSSLKANTTGTSNTAVGTSSLTALVNGNRNTAVGSSALLANTAGNDNVAVGQLSFQYMRTAATNRNIAIGSFAGNVIGSGGGGGLESATGGIFIGYNSKASANAQTNEIVIGTDAVGLGSNTAVIGATTQTAATVYGLMSATNGVSAGGVSTFNAGVTFASTTDHTGVARFATGVTVSGRLDVGGVLDVVSGTTLESTLNVVGNALFAAGVTTSTLYVSGGSTFAAAINAPGIVSSWSVITADQTAEINKGYLTNKATVLGLTLPSSAAVGSMIRVSGMTAAGWKITQNASQVIHFGKTDTTVGTAGYLQSTLARDGVELVCCVANNEWNVVSSVGNITIV